MKTTPSTCPKCGGPLADSSPAGLCPRCLMAMNLATQTVLSADNAASTPKPASPTAEEIARHLPGFEVLECLGRGGMGVVYKARQKSLNRLVALKILAPEREKDAAFAQRFAVEAATLARLNHPGIVTIYDFGQADGLFYFAMEFVDGVSLRQLLERGRVSPREALAIVPEICEALQYAHDHGIVHRDIKPENILLDCRGRVKVADFGLAKLIGGEGLSVRYDDQPPGASPDAPSPVLTEAGKILGTPHYMAPEQVEHPAQVDHRADIYALGVMFYQMLTGELPGKRIEPPSRKVQIDVRLDQVVLRALEQDPDRRYAQASVLKTQLETIAQTQSAVSQPPRPRRKAWATAGVLLALAGAFGFGVWAAGRARQTTVLAATTNRTDSTTGNPETEPSPARLSANPDARATHPTQGSLNDLDAKIVQLSTNGTPFAEATRLLGEPERYAWGDRTFQKTNLPQAFVACYTNGVQVAVNRGWITELRSGPGTPGFTWHGQLHLGSTLEEVLAVVGQPRMLVTNQPAPRFFADGVLYQDIGGRQGYSHYGRAEQNVRFFFNDNKVSALYVRVDSRPNPGASRVSNTNTASHFAVDSHSKAGLSQVLQPLQPHQDVRSKDLSGLNQSPHWELLPTLTFNQQTVWPTPLPPGVDPAQLLEQAKNPGLGIRQLHQAGWTGKGVNVGIIDQPLYPDHPEFAGKIAAYADMGCQSKTSMHGPAVTSLLVGSQCGTAPDARVYYAAAPTWKRDAAFYAKALDWLVAQNAKLPPKNKIRVVSVSAAPSGRGSPFDQNREQWDAAYARAERAGLLVLDCTEHHNFLGPCYSDTPAPASAAQCQPGFPSHPGMPMTGKWLLVPCCPRTIAEEYVQGDFGYQYWGEAGLSWSLPYCAGVLALGWQARPDLTPAQMRDLLFKSAYQAGDGSPIINPTEFIRLVRAAPKSRY